MVDAVVSLAVKKLKAYLVQEAVIFQGARNEVQLLKNELEWMQCFIKDAEEKQIDDAMIGKWVSDVRDIAYDAEDVLDRFMLQVRDEGISNMLKVDERGNPRGRTGFFASIKRCFCIFNQASNLYSKGKEMVNLYIVGKEIKQLRHRMSDLSRKRELYCLDDIGNKGEERSDGLARLMELRGATSFVEEKVIGFEDDANKLLAKLLEKEPQRYVISIFGMGGLGKTTLAKKLYHSDDVKRNFDCCAWVSVSREYRTQDLLMKIIKSFKITTMMEELQTMNQEDLERYLYDCLKGRIYLVVIDDVWEKETWQSLKRAFPDNQNGSRVIITTRKRDVAEYSDERTHVYELRFLRPEESWKLFCEKAFQNSNADESLEKQGREMMEKCGGLPLAIVVLGGLLSRKKPQGWRMVRDHIWRYLRNDSLQISYLLAVSFNDLSYQLKLCFLYLGLYPADFLINMEELIRLLVAEGFIQEVEGLTMEEVAQDYLNELINRSLIQVDSRYQGRAQTCRVHDLLRDLAIQKAKELNFIHIYDEINNAASSSIISSCRRQAFYFENKMCAWLQQCNRDSRSLLLFKPYWDFLSKLSTLISTRFKLLRVLHVEGYRGLGDHSQSLPKEIGQLIHLKHLGLKNVCINYIPPSIVHLQNLQTLDLYSYNCQIKLPTEISKLQELRHLIGNIEGPLPVDNLTNLQTLKYIQHESWCKVNPESLINLRELHIDGCLAKGEKKFTFHSIAKLKSLRTLWISLENYDSFASLKPLSHLSFLKDLTLDGRMNKLPGDMHTLLPNLECLSLINSHLQNDPMPTLEKLPNLIILKLHYKSYFGKRMTCTATGFLHLEILQIINLDELEEWHIEEGAMPVLRSLVIDPKHPQLRLPQRLTPTYLSTGWDLHRDGYHRR